MELKNGKGKHIVLFGTFNESKYFLGEFKDKFDSICFNANIIAHAPEGIAAFVSQLSNKSYFIDPQLHAFQHNPKTIMRKKDGQLILKSSIEKLARLYKLSNAENNGVRQITPGCLSGTEFMNICESILRFQHDYISENIKNLDVTEFLDDVEIKPEFLIAPYFYMDSENLTHSVADNIAFINESVMLMDTLGYNQIPLFAEIAVSKKVITNEDNATLVVDKYCNSHVKGFVLWVDDLSENDGELDEHILIAFKNFLIKLTNSNKPVINLHGSYFSTVLSSPEFGLLAGVGHGIEYGEDRAVVPVGGGVPLSKFYFPKFYKRINYSPDTVDILLHKKWVDSPELYYRNVCSCKMCTELINHAPNVTEGFQEYGLTNISKKNNKAYPDFKAMEKSRKHYLYTKLQEFSFLEKASKSEIISSLGKSVILAEELKDIHSFNHLEVWYKILSNF